MYKPADKTQTSFLDFNQPMGLKMNPDNRWIQMAGRIPWNLFEEKYAGLFPSDTGNVAKPLRMALGSLIIQNRFQYPDRELVEQITENPYLQYFIGLPGYQDTLRLMQVRQCCSTNEFHQICRAGQKNTFLLIRIRITKNA